MVTTVDTRTFTHALTGSRADYDPLLDLVGDAHFVLIGEASHGTYEFYRERAAITRRLIAEKGFNAVAVEADWPDAYRANVFARGHSSARDADAALSGFERFPTWMWRNRDVLAFVEWLRAYNAELPEEKPKAGFYGMDLYSMHASMNAVLTYLRRVDPEAAERAERRYSCFDHFGEDPQSYGYHAAYGLGETCQAAVVGQLLELQRRAPEYAQLDGRVAADDFFYAEQNARLVRNAEEYYRSMFQGRISSWNLRDQHMVETVASLLEHLDRYQPRTKAVLWAHNSHLGDARATEMGANGELNVGQLVRETWPGECCLIGFSTYTGTVTAASRWGGEAERKRVRPALPTSYEALMHETHVPRFMLDLGRREAAESLWNRRLERAIGVIYLPETERHSHYFHASLPAQFDALIHLEHTTALEPLERTQRWDAGELPETYPTGF
jgi:erythromycin esterase-like protein